LQWFWFLDTAIGVYFLLKEYAAAEVTSHFTRAALDILPSLPILLPLFPSPPPINSTLPRTFCQLKDGNVCMCVRLTIVPGAQVELKRCRKSKDAKGERAAKWRMINAVLDMSKSLTDLPLAVHYGEEHVAPNHSLLFSFWPAMAIMSLLAS